MDNRDFIMAAMHTAGAADASAIAAKSISGEADGTALIAAEEQIPTWRLRDYTDVPIGTPYKYGDQVYKLWQAHDATNQPDWTPDKAVSLWDICHTTDPAKAKPYVAPQGTRGMYQIDDVCTEGGKLYRSTMEIMYGNLLHIRRDGKLLTSRAELSHSRKSQRSPLRNRKNPSIRILSSQPEHMTHTISVTV